MKYVGFEGEYDVVPCPDGREGCLVLHLRKKEDLR